MQVYSRSSTDSPAIVKHCFYLLLDFMKYGGVHTAEGRNLAVGSDGLLLSAHGIKQFPAHLVKPLHDLR